MRRRDFLKGTINSLVLLGLGNIRSDSQQIEITASIDDRLKRETNASESLYRTTRKRLTNSGLEIIEEYSLDIQSERLVIYLPDMHHPIFIGDQKKRIELIISLLKNKQIALGLEGYYQELTPEFIRQAKVSHETFEGTKKEDAILNANIKEVGTSFIELATEDPNRKESIRKLLLEFKDITKHVLSTVATNKGYTNQIHAPGSAYLFENYPQSIHLFGTENDDTYLQRYAEYDNLLKMEYIEVLRIKTQEMAAKFKIEPDDKRIKDILSITEVLESMLSVNCNKYQFCREYKERADRTKFKIGFEDMSQMLADLDSIRNIDWSEKVKKLDRKYKIVVVIGGAGHLKSRVNQEITKYASMITIDTHIERYNPTL